MNRQHAPSFYINPGSHMGHVSRVMLHLAFSCCVVYAHAGEGVAGAVDAVEKVSGPTDKKFNIYDYSTWPRSISALSRFKEIANEQSGYKYTIDGASRGQDKRCQYYFKALKSAAQKELRPVYSTDDGNAPVLRKYRKQCPVYSRNGEYVRDGDYLLERFGNFNYRLYRLHGVVGGGDVLCADADTLLIEGRFVTCGIPNVKECGFFNYGEGRLRGRSIFETANSVVNSDGVPDIDYPYGISLVQIGKKYYGLSAMKQPVHDAQYYAFRLRSFDYSGDAFCSWEFVKKK